MDDLIDPTMRHHRRRVAIAADKLARRFGILVAEDGTDEEQEDFARLPYVRLETIPQVTHG